MKWIGHSLHTVCSLSNYSGKRKNGTMQLHQAKFIDGFNNHTFPSQNHLKSDYIDGISKKYCDLPCPVNPRQVQRIWIHHKLQCGQEEQAASSQFHKPCPLYPSWPVTIHILKCHYLCSIRKYTFKKVSLEVLVSCQIKSTTTTLGASISRNNFFLDFQNKTTKGKERKQSPTNNMELW